MTLEQLKNAEDVMNYSKTVEESFSTFGRIDVPATLEKQIINGLLKDLSKYAKEAGIYGICWRLIYRNGKENRRRDFCR